MNFDLERLNNKKMELGEKPLDLKNTYYPYPENDGENLLDKNGEKIGTKGDMYTKIMLNDILQRGCLDNNPRPHYDDMEPAHTLSLNHGQTSSKVFTYDISKGESPFITLRPIAVKSSIGELLWIYQDASNDLDKLNDLWNTMNATRGGSMELHLTRRSNNFELVVIDQLAAFLHFYDDNQRIKSTLYIKSPPVIREFERIYDQILEDEEYSFHVIHCKECVTPIQC